MKTAQFALLRSLKNGVSPRNQQSHIARTFSSEAVRAGETEYERSYGDLSELINNVKQRSQEGSSKTSAFFQKFDKVGMGRDSFSSSDRNGSRISSVLDGIDESLNSLQDGIDAKLEKAAYGGGLDSFTVSRNFGEGMNHRMMDRGGPARERFRRPRVVKEFQPSTQEVLKNADFRNVRFLANFLTESGMMIKRSHTRISAKAQRKVAREIKTARSFGLLPFTTMGTKSFTFGKSMEDRDDDFEYESLDGNVMRQMPEAL